MKAESGKEEKLFGLLKQTPVHRETPENNTYYSRRKLLEILFKGKWTTEIVVDATLNSLQMVNDKAN